MSCYHPLVGIRPVGSDGKLTIVKNKYLEKVNEPEVIADYKSRGYDCFLLPCGRCVGCRLDYSREWANRCMMEASLYQFNWFLTLTYDDVHLPFDRSLDKKVFSTFMKNLRRYYQFHYDHTGIRFFACGEYGSKYARPHYHAILFNLPIYDLRLYSRKDNKITYNSDILSSIWKNGFLTINECNWHTCAYVARYMLKKKKGDERDFYKEIGLQPEFTLASRNPGIGYSYLEEKVYDIYKTDSILIPKGKSVITVKPPKYFDRIVSERLPDLYCQVKENRSFVSDINYKSKLGYSTLSPQAQRDVEEKIKEDTVKSLARFYEL